MEHQDDDTAPQASAGGEKDNGLLFGGGVALGAALLAVVWIAVSIIRGSADPAATEVGSQVTGPLAAATTSPPPSRLARCQDAAITLGTPLQAAQPAMDQWAVHIGAMNKLVVGAITLQQATAFWDETRIGAARKIADFRKSMRYLRNSGVDCPAPELLPHTTDPALRACVRHVDASVRALRAARTAISTWDMHVRDMERLRNGKLSPAKASAMWVAMWQRGQQELTTYRKANRDAARAGTCDGLREMPTSSAAPAGVGPSGGTAGPSGAPSASADADSMDMPGMG